MQQTELALGDLLPHERVKGETKRNFDLSKLTVIDDGVPPSPEFVEDVRVNGLFYPLLAVKTATGLLLIDGLRRFKALAHLGVKRGDVKIVELDELRANVAALIVNTKRSHNPIAEARMIANLMARGADESVIAQATGMPVATIRQRLALLDMPLELRDGVRDRKLSMSSAARLARMDPGERAKAVQILVTNGKLTGRDVADIRRAGAADAAAHLPATLFVVDSPSSAPATPWPVGVLQHIEAALKLLPEEENFGPLGMMLTEAKERAIAIQGSAGHAAAT